MLLASQADSCRKDATNAVLFACEAAPSYRGLYPAHRCSNIGDPLQRLVHQGRKFIVLEVE
ncbi:hypothetical protein PC116_g6340 [Phytophthora cactorum]|nr:hypothetical protein PC116_g6340 [Phytophthora cactorum]